MTFEHKNGMETTSSLVTHSYDNFLLTARQISSTRKLNCRICLEEDNESDLISPCECRGSLQFVHTQCLQHWFDVMHERRCQICKTQYELEDRGMKPYTEWTLPQPLSDDWEDQLDFKCALFWLIFMSRVTYVMLKHGIGETRLAIIHIVGGGIFLFRKSLFHSRYSILKSRMLNICLQYYF
ncbi:E3 ubiquitin-protein ligase [Dirofilaria immitis]